MGYDRKTTLLFPNLKGQKFGSDRSSIFGIEIRKEYSGTAGGEISREEWKISENEKTEDGNEDILQEDSRMAGRYTGLFTDNLMQLPERS